MVPPIRHRYFLAKRTVIVVNEVRAERLGRVRVVKIMISYTDWNYILPEFNFWPYSQRPVRRCFCRKNLIAPRTRENIPESRTVRDIRNVFENLRRVFLLTETNFVGQTNRNSEMTRLLRRSSCPSRETFGISPEKPTIPVVSLANAPKTTWNAAIGNGIRRRWKKYENRKKIQNVLRSKVDTCSGVVRKIADPLQRKRNNYVTRFVDWFAKRKKNETSAFAKIREHVWRILEKTRSFPDKFRFGGKTNFEIPIKRGTRVVIRPVVFGTR